MTTGPPAPAGRRNESATHDGIVVQRTPLPRWLLAGLAAAAVCGAALVVTLRPGGPPVPQDEATTLARHDGIELKVLADPACLARGAAIYARSCALCHRPDGAGRVGVNLTDDHWIHGGRIQDLYQTVTLGIPSKGMPDFKDRLTPQERLEVCSHVLATLKARAAQRPPESRPAPK